MTVILGREYNILFSGNRSSRDQLPDGIPLNLTFFLPSLVLGSNKAALQHAISVGHLPIRENRPDKEDVATIVRRRYETHFILLIGDDKNFRVRKVTWATETFLAFVAVGGGYSMTVTLTNTGDSAISGSLILTDPQGQPLTASVAGVGAGSSFPVSIAPAGTTFLSINPVGKGDPLKTGWATIATSGGLLNAGATFHLMSGGVTQAVAGVLPSQPMRYATIPIDDDSSQRRLTAYAVANPTSQNLVIKLALVDQDGQVVDDNITITLAPKQQTARYLNEDVARPQFKGSIVLRAQEGGSFVAMALRHYQTLFTVIPVISGKAPSVPD